MQKLTNQEAQRVVNCLDDSLTRLHVLSFVPAGNPDPDLLDALGAEGMPELQAALAEQWEAEEKFLVARAQASSLQQMSGNGSANNRRHKGGLPPPPGGLHISGKILGHLHQSVRESCRQLRRDPSGFERVTGVSGLVGGGAGGGGATGGPQPQSPQSQAVPALRGSDAGEEEKEGGSEGYANGGATSPEFTQLHNTMAELMLVTHRKLATTVEEEQGAKNLMHELVERERAAEDERNALSATLELQRSERAVERRAVDMLLSKLKKELAHISESNSSEVAAIAAASSDARGANLSAHTEAMAQLEAEKAALAKTLAEQSVSHREVEVGLRKKKEKKEREVAKVVRAYDAAVGAKKTEMDGLKAVMAEEKASLDALEEHFAKVDANKAQRNEEDRVLAEFRNKVEGARKLLTLAAVRVQKIVRGRKCRAELKAAGGKKGKKGKKK